jgi:hypothetical protein
MAQLPLSTAIYQLRPVLAGISPMIWRRLLVSSETTIAQLHQYFIANWRVDMRLEEILPHDQRILPVCVGG